jgi:nicotinamidase-related amidase
MALTTLDPNTALVVIDLQKGMLFAPVVHPFSDIVSRASALAEAFRRHAMPVVLVNVAGGPPGRTERPRSTTAFPPEFTDMLPELNQQPQDHVVTKRTPGAFTDTDLEAYLKGQGITQIVMVGVSTTSGVESTARHAFELGFNVSFAIDAMSDLDAEAHANSVNRIFPKLGETGTTQEVIDMLEKRA